MKKTLIIIAIVLFFLLVEFVFANMVGYWFKPNLFIILMIFVGLYWGIRWALFVAILAGLLMDSFEAGAFGVNTLSFILCAYVIILTRRYLFYDVEFGFLRILMTFLVSALNILVQYGIRSLYHVIDFSQVYRFVFLPEVLATTLIASVVFRGLKRCVLKLSV